MNHILPAMAAGASAGGILLLLSHVAPLFGAGNFVRDLDQPKLLGRDVTRREAHIAGMLIHLLVSIVGGGGYAFLISTGVISNFHFLPILAWSGIIALVMGGIVLPLEGHGVFGFKEDAWFPIDLLLTNVLWAILFWWLMRVWIGLAVFS
ncbi:MAG: hypothetical protein WC787_03275 [Patescibacteria group bacterium]|jgi:hypothetical protein